MLLRHGSILRWASKRRRSKFSWQYLGSCIITLIIVNSSPVAFASKAVFADQVLQKSPSFGYWAFDPGPPSLSGLSSPSSSATRPRPSWASPSPSATVTSSTAAPIISSSISITSTTRSPYYFIVSDKNKVAKSNVTSQKTAVPKGSPKKITRNGNVYKKILPKKPASNLRVPERYLKKQPFAKKVPIKLKKGNNRQKKADGLKNKKEHHHGAAKSPPIKATNTTTAKSNATSSVSAGDVPTSSTSSNKPPAGLLALTKGQQSTHQHYSTKKQVAGLPITYYYNTKPTTTTTILPIAAKLDSKKVQSGNKKLEKEKNGNSAAAAEAIVISGRPATTTMLMGADEDIGYDYEDYASTYADGMMNGDVIEDYVDEMEDDVIPGFMNPQFHSLAKGNLSQMGFMAMGAALYGDASLKSQMNDLEAYSVEDNHGGLIVFLDKEALEKEMLQDYPARKPAIPGKNSNKPPTKGASSSDDETAGKVPQQHPILEKRNLVQFARIVRVHNTVSPFYFIFYGNWCGPLGDGPAADGIDQCCKVHDHCYGDVMYDACPPGWRNPYTVIYNWKVAHGPRGGKRAVCLPGDPCGRETCLCDQRAAECFGRNVFNRRHVGQRLFG